VRGEEGGVVVVQSWKDAEKKEKKNARSQSAKVSDTSQSCERRKKDAEKEEIEKKEGRSCMKEQRTSK